MCGLQRVGLIALGVSQSREVARWVRPDFSVSVLRFRLSLIEPDVRICRIRLSDGFHRHCCKGLFETSVLTQQGLRATKQGFVEVCPRWLARLKPRPSRTNPTFTGEVFAPSKTFTAVVSQADPQVHPTAHPSSAHTAPSVTAEPLVLGLLDLAVNPLAVGRFHKPHPKSDPFPPPALHSLPPVLRTCPPPLGRMLPRPAKERRPPVRILPAYWPSPDGNGGFHSGFEVVPQLIQAI